MADFDLWSEIIQKQSLLSECIKSMKKVGRDRANAEHDYKLALRKEIFTLHEVDKVAWTACSSMAHGDDSRYNVADKRLMRDLSQADYDTLSEKIMALKLDIRILESQLNREWGQAK